MAAASTHNEQLRPVSIQGGVLCQLVRLVGAQIDHAWPRGSACCRKRAAAHQAPKHVGRHAESIMGAQADL